MSTAATNWAKRQRTGNPTAKAILMAIADDTGSNGISIPITNADIAWEAECGPDTVRRWVVRMEKDGLLTRFSNAGMANEYRLHMGGQAIKRGLTDDELQAEKEAQTPGRLQGVAPPSPSADCEGSHPTQIATPTSYEEESTPQSPPGGAVDLTNEDLEKRVLAFEKVYPVPTTKREALARLIGALDQTEYDLLVTAGAGYALFCAKEKRRHMDPAKFARSPAEWPGFAKLAPLPEPEKIFIQRGSRQWDALCVLRAVCFGKDHCLPSLAPAGMAQAEGREGTLVDDHLDFVAMDSLAAFASETGGPDFEDWGFCIEKSRQWWAWNERATKAGFSEIEARTIHVLGPPTPKEALGKTYYFQPRIHGVHVPSEWPPKLTKPDGDTDDGEAAELDQEAAHG